jgi:hypothetical protein
LALIRSILQLNPLKRPSALHCLDADFFLGHVRYDSIQYKPPLLEEHLEKKPVEIVFRMEDEVQD